MKKRILILLILAISLTACGKAENTLREPEVETMEPNMVDDESISESEKEYRLEEIENFDVTFGTIYGITNNAASGEFLVFADEGAYLMSEDKIYTNGTHFNLDWKIDYSKAWQMGDRDDIYNVNESDFINPPTQFEKFLIDNNNSSVIDISSSFNGKIITGNEEFAPQVMVWSEKNVTVYEEEWNSQELVEVCNLSVPGEEKIIKAIEGEYGNILFVTNKDHILYIGIPEDDPSNTYADVLPQYSLLQDQMYELLKEEFAGNIKFYNGYLVTMDNKCYRVLDNKMEFE